MRQIKKLQIGKNGLTAEFIEQVKSIFEKEKLIKVSILKSACRDKVEADKMAKELIGALGPKYGYKLVGYVVMITKYRKVWNG